MSGSGIEPLFSEHHQTLRRTPGVRTAEVTTILSKIGYLFGFAKSISSSLTQRLAWSKIAN